VRGKSTTGAAAQMVNGHSVGWLPLPCARVRVRVCGMGARARRQSVKSILAINLYLLLWSMHSRPSAACPSSKRDT